MESNINDLRYIDLKHSTWRQVEKAITFEGGTTNAIGDFDGTGEPHNIFIVTGTVLAKVLAICSTTLTIVATATLKVGTSITTAGVIAQTAGDAIDINEIWHDATPDASIELFSVLSENIISDDIIGTTATENITAGVIKYICLWKPLSANGNVVAA